LNRPGGAHAQVVELGSRYRTPLRRSEVKEGRIAGTKLRDRHLGKRGSVGGEER